MPKILSNPLAMTCEIRELVHIWGRQDENCVTSRPSRTDDECGQLSSVMEIDPLIDTSLIPLATPEGLPWRTLSACSCPMPLSMAISTPRRRSHGAIDGILQRPGKDVEQSAYSLRMFAGCGLFLAGQALRADVWNGALFAPSRAILLARVQWTSPRICLPGALPR